jgi:hypothetical protein
VMNIARALELDDGEKNALRGAWQRSREAKDGRGTKARPAPEAATFTRAERNRRVLALRLPHMRLPHMGRPSTAQFVIAAAVLLTLVVLAGVSAVTHRPPQLGGAVTTGHTTATPVIPKPVSTVPASSSPAGVTRAIASVTKSGPCRWYAYLTVTGLPPRAHVVLFSDYIGHSCNGRTYHGTWRRAAGMVGSSGTWSYALVQNDYGTYRYTAVTAAGTRTPIDFHYGPRARAIG